TGSGIVTLMADCAAAQQTKVNGSQAFWLRGRLTDPLPQDPLNSVPEVDSIKLNTTINQTLSPVFSVSAPYAPDVSTAVALVFSPGFPSSSAPLAATTPSAGSLGGVVKNEAGQPVQGAVVTISNPDDPTFGQVSSPATGKDGKYSFNSAPLGV